MAIVCWGNLGKSADDNLRIEQSIHDYVEGHNENVNAHQIEGSSLYMHRVQEELDHKYGSVDLKYLTDKKLVALICFETFDAWEYNWAAASNYIFGSSFDTDAIDNDEANMWLENLSGICFDPSKNPFFQTTLKLYDSTNVEAFFGFGSNEIDSGDDGAGFKFVNGTEYAIWTYNGITYTYELSNIVTTNFHTYRVLFDSSIPALYFYVDGELVYTVTDTVPTLNNDYLFMYWLKTTTANMRRIYFTDLLLTMDR